MSPAYTEPIAPQPTIATFAIAASYAARALVVSAFRIARVPSAVPAIPPRSGVFGPEARTELVAARIEAAALAQRASPCRSASQSRSMAAERMAGPGVG